jgi:tetratricopeptide (TPR) repeat protein
MGAGLSLFAFIIYLTTMCPSIDVIDAGELSTVAYTLGIAHPTGYPLFSLVGWLFSHVLFPFRVVERVNIMAALLCSAGLFFFFRFFVFFIRDFTLSKFVRVKEKLSSKEELFRVYVPASCGVLVLAFSETYWSQSNSVEVYSLHLLLLSINLFFFAKAISTASNGIQKDRYWYLWAFVLGLGFCNHMTTILLAPAFLFAFFYTHGFGENTWRKLLRLSVPFLLALSAYLFLVIRAGEKPIMNWGNPISLERLYWHFSGKQYRVWLFSSTESAERQFQYFKDGLLSEFGYIPVLFALLGLWKLWKKEWQILVFTLLLFVGCVLYSINYDIHDIDSYFLLAYITVAIWAAAGVAKLIEEKMAYARWIGIGAIIISLSPLYVNYPNADEHDFTMVENYSKDILKSVEPNGIVISYQWDYFVSAMNYLQFVEGVRPDVIVVDKELLRRSWYYVQLEKRYPEFIRKSRPAIDAFLQELYKFEHDLPYDQSMIEYRYAAMIKSFIDQNYSTCPVYATVEIEQEYTQGYQRVPAGLIFQLSTDSLWHEHPMPVYDITLPRKQSKYTDGMVSMYAKAYVNNAIYLSMAGRTSAALELVDKALALVPDMPEALEWKERLQKGG